MIFADPLEGFSTSLIGHVAGDDGWPAGFFAVTRDGGRTWAQEAPPAAGGPPHQYALPVLSDPDHGVLATLGGTIPNLTLGFDTTSDGGRTWQPRTSLAITEQSGLKWPIFQRDPTVAVASPTTWWTISPTEPPNVELTTDAGAHWTSLTTSSPPAAPDELYALDATHPWAQVTTSIPGSPSDALNGDDYTLQVYFHRRRRPRLESGQPSL